MKIKFALISKDNISDAQELSIKLQGALEAGEMRAVDQTTKELLLLTDKNPSLSFSEQYWHQLIEEVRSFNENFKTDFLITEPQLKMIIAADVTESFADVVSIVNQALKTDGFILQIPFETVDDYV